MSTATRDSWLQRYLATMVGARVVQVGVTDDGWPFFDLQEPPRKGGRRHRVEVSCDPEGNGPGFLHGLPQPEAKP